MAKSQYKDAFMLIFSWGCTTKIMPIPRRAIIFFVVELVKHLLPFASIEKKKSRGG